MARRKKIYEGGAKILYEGPEPGTLIAYFKDDSAPTPEQANPAAVDGKGVLNNRLSEFFMSGLHGIGMGTCLLYTSPSPRDRTRSRMPSSA